MTGSQRSALLPPVDSLDDVPAQDVIDALRLACVAQDDDAKIGQLVRAMLEYAPETDGSRGIDFLLRLIRESVLAVEVADR